MKKSIQHLITGRERWGWGPGRIGNITCMCFSTFWILNHENHLFKYSIIKSKQNLSLSLSWVHENFWNSLLWFEYGFHSPPHWLRLEFNFGAVKRVETNPSVVFRDGGHREEITQVDGGGSVRTQSRRDMPMSVRPCLLPCDPCVLCYLETPLTRTISPKCSPWTRSLPS